MNVVLNITCDFQKCLITICEGFQQTGVMCNAVFNSARLTSVQGLNHPAP